MNGPVDITRPHVGANPWQIGGEPLVNRLRELHAARPQFSFELIARKLTSEFGIRISRNAAIGKATRIGLPDRLPQVGFGSRPKGPRPRLADVVPLHASLVDLTYDQCRYPYGDGPFTFCGCPTINGLSYCEPHHRLTHLARSA